MVLYQQFSAASVLGLAKVWAPMAGNLEPSMPYTVLITQLLSDPLIPFYNVLQYRAPLKELAP
jgi:hypothetical protein